MKWITALFFGLVIGGILPTVIDSKAGVWTDGWTGWALCTQATAGFCSRSLSS